MHAQVSPIRVWTRLRAPVRLRVTRLQAARARELSARAVYAMFGCWRTFFFVHTVQFKRDRFDNDDRIATLSQR